MMIPFTDEERAIYDKLEVTKDPDEIKKLRDRLREIAKQIDEEYKDCPFVH